MWISINPFIAALNRYSNIIPCKIIYISLDSHSIVKPDSQFDKNKFNTPRDKFYINANYIKVSNIKRIISQSQIKKKHILLHKDQFQKVLLISGIWCGPIMLE